MKKCCVVPPTPLPLTPLLWRRWDYGYQITAMGNRSVIVDNNTWNNTHIATVGERSCRLHGLLCACSTAHVSR